MYPHHQILAHLRVIHTNIPRLLSVTTDITGDITHRSQNTLVLQRTSGNKTTRVDLTPHVLHEDRAIDRLAKETSLSPSVAKEVYWAGRELFKLNPRGSWCTAQGAASRGDDVAPVGEARESVHAMVADALDRLDELLPKVDTIYVDTGSKNGSDGRVRTWLWLRFDRDGQEVAAINNAAIATHVADGLRPRPSEYLQANQLRLAAWAKQLGLAVDDAPEALHLASFVAAQLGYDTIPLR
ncbi:hypothetical protein RHOFW510R12_00580 [Rhodanobacter sp. FW510-R12]|uniref:hypothetical protein n=1 Tax=Rhodanobacter thiooxydans TaxID=416169 RepID=UPI00091B1E1C|nr:hypothetical protein [Rhodanobacter thiooxydans]UJJ56736.1 hypothetical protein LRK53_18135 [Rhodanobacter thiooxydans]